MHFVVRFARGAVIVALFVTAAGAGILSGVLFAYAGDLPEIEALDDYAPSTITRVYGSGGELVGEFAVQRRLIVGYDDIAPRLRQAIIAAEDGDFNSHFGLSISDIIAAVVRDVLRAGADVAAGRKTSRPGGASTLTQQLARTLFPQTVGFSIGDLSLERKIKEAIVAIQIEKRYTKEEILTFYANHMLLGHGTYGVEAGARLYFGKAAKDVSLEEAAMLAGIFQLPARQSPFVNVGAATGRRNYALQRMADEGFITQAEADEAKKRPVVVRGQPQQPSSIAPFFLEEVRQHLEQKYGRRRCTRAAWLSAPPLTRRSSVRRTGPSTTACEPWTSVGATVGRHATCWPKAIRSTRSGTNGGRDQSTSATSCPRSLLIWSAPPRPTALAFGSDATPRTSRPPASRGHGDRRRQACSRRATSSRSRS